LNLGRADRVRDAGLSAAVRRFRKVHSGSERRETDRGSGKPRGEHKLIGTRLPDCGAAVHKVSRRITPHSLRAATGQIVAYLKGCPGAAFKEVRAVMTY
jgi:hypothetical protein